MLYDWYLTNWMEFFDYFYKVQKFNTIGIQQGCTY